MVIVFFLVDWLVKEENQSIPHVRGVPSQCLRRIDQRHKHRPQGLETFWIIPHWSVQWGNSSEKLSPSAHTKWVLIPSIIVVGVSSISLGFEKGRLDRVDLAQVILSIF